MTGLSVSTQNTPPKDTARSAFPRVSPRTPCCRTPRNLTLSASKSNHACFPWLVPANPAGFLSALAHGSRPTCRAETLSSSHERRARWTSFALWEQHVLRQTAETTFVRSEQADAVEAAYAGSTEGG